MNKRQGSIRMVIIILIIIALLGPDFKVIDVDVDFNPMFGLLS